MNFRFEILLREYFVKLTKQPSCCACHRILKLISPTLKEISLSQTRIDHKSVSSGALKKSFHILLITTGHSVVIICMRNRLHLFTDTVKTEQGGQQGVKASKQPSLT